MKRILIVVDMQNDFIDGSLGTKEARCITPHVIERIKRSKNELILFTKDTHETNYLETQEGGMLPVVHCIEGTEGWQINGDVMGAWLENKETIVDEALKQNTLCKNTFGSKNLAEYLVSMKNEIHEIELIGLCTDICVISNALLIKAFLPEVKISLDAGCCAGVTPQSHQTALDAMKMCQICIK